MAWSTANVNVNIIHGAQIVNYACHCLTIDNGCRQGVVKQTNAKNVSVIIMLAVAILMASYLRIQITRRAAYAMIANTIHLVLIAKIVKKIFGVILNDLKMTF